MNSTGFRFDERLDSNFLNSIYDEDMEYAEIVFEKYLVQTPAHLKLIEQAFQSGTVEEFRQLVHKIKPVFSYVGLTCITAQAEMLEKKCNTASSISELMPLYTEFINDVNDYKAVIEIQFTAIKEQNK